MEFNPSLVAAGIVLVVVAFFFLDIRNLLRRQLDHTLNQEMRQDALEMVQGLAKVLDDNEEIIKVALDHLSKRYPQINEDVLVHRLRTALREAAAQLEKLQ